MKDSTRGMKNCMAFLYALVVFNRDMGNLDAAGQYARKLIALYPQDPTALRLLKLLKQQ